MIGARSIRAAINVRALIRVNLDPRTLLPPAVKLKKQLAGPVAALASAGITTPAAVNGRALLLPAGRRLRAVKPENGGINKTAAAKITALIRQPAIIRPEAVAVVTIGILQAVSAV